MNNKFVWRKNNRRLMTLLSCVPKYPIGVRVSSLAMELGYKDRGALIDDVHALNKRGIGVYVRDTPTGEKVSVRPSTWSLAQEEVEKELSHEGLQEPDDLG